MTPLNIRNVAIVAHVDHGKTTLIDSMLKQSGLFHSNQVVQDRVMDNHDLERERGITIIAKCASITWLNTKINIIDTPGHVDFSAEVERTLNMVSGVILLVDSVEGVMPQTKFILRKVLEMALKVIVVINKVDRQNNRISEVIEEIYELFVFFNANNEQLDFPIIYASGKNGWATEHLDIKHEDLKPLFNKIIDYIPKPDCSLQENFSMLVMMKEHNPYFGDMVIGRIHNGIIKCNQHVKILNMNDQMIGSAKVNKILSFQGLEKVTKQEAFAGDIVLIAGVEQANIGDTICDYNINTSIPAVAIGNPTLSIGILVNDSPISGSEGTKFSLVMLRDRLIKEAKRNVSIKVETNNENDVIQVHGHGELQLGILIEDMRREGYELSVARPKVLYKNSNDEQKLEPIEEIHVFIEDRFASIIINSLKLRKAEVVDMFNKGNTLTIIFRGPSRGLIGYYSQFLSETKGTGIINRSFYEYSQYLGVIKKRVNGVLISNSYGVATEYALWNLEARGKMFIKSGEIVYKGMIIGEHNQANDLEVNPIKTKQLTNVRTVFKDEAIRITTPISMTLEQAISYIETDELVEITPKSVRLRKKILGSFRKR